MRHEESKLQQACIRWFRIAYPEMSQLLFAVPNGYKTSLSQARIAKAEGMLAGVADLILLTPAEPYHALCIEMKTAKGRQQPSQKAFQTNVEAAGYKYVICRSFNDFRHEICTYMREKQFLCSKTRLSSALKPDNHR